ncbi:MAG: malto-oligosyltrehalose trehalohydrolase [Rubrivivax sp.]|nr:malto-oligosyltrehalose trehalohydrolase [Rubrivivax sp.]MDH5338670.1 malto-oligosyltrehalose trehalohydrolase [Rubrivivax sp.]
MKRVHAMPFGARRTADGGAVFRLWAPGTQRVDLVRSAGPDVGETAMAALPDGWFEVEVARADDRTRYAFRVDGNLQVPDPASRSNPDDVHAPSALSDPAAFDWPDDGWRGRPWHEAVIYELHIGCFTPEGSFAAAIGRLDDLVALGVTAIELMPVADFPGRRGWGYDGVLLFAPESSYGSPDDLKRLVAAAHARGLMVLLDVVYNHFGPDGNYLHAYAKSFFNAEVPTPWGAAINFDGAHSDTVRDFFVHNALYWIEEFHFDGLRIDAVHAMHDRSATHFVDELAQRVRAGPGRDRAVHLVLENDVNDARRLARGAGGRATLADAQWNDDVHHSLHVIASGETDGYYADFAGEPVRLLGRALAEGFAFQGEASAYRGGKPHGTPSVQLPPLAFVNSTQTHDQVGNRAFGERIATLAAAQGHEEALRALVACVLLAPSPPMLFMGEEYAAATPFLYFCDFGGDLAQAVTRGRRAEFGRFARFADPAVRDRIPDPNADSTFLDSKLDWSERGRGPHARWLALYASLLRLRRDMLVPWLAGARSGKAEMPAPGTLRIAWPLAGGRRWHLLAQLAGHDGPSGLAKPPGEAVFRSHPAASGLPAWSVQVSSEAP